MNRKDCLLTYHSGGSGLPGPDHDDDEEEEEDLVLAHVQLAGFLRLDEQPVAERGHQLYKKYSCKKSFKETILFLTLRATKLRLRMRLTM